MNKKVVALAGSPRRRSFTEKILDLFLAGMEPAACKKYYPQRMAIKYCQGCMACWFKTPGRCTIKDEMTAFLKTEIETADVVILASPVYVDGFSAQLKTVLDRCFALLDPLLVFDEKGRCRHQRFKPRAQTAVLISTCGFSEKVNFEPLRRHFAAVCQNLHWQNGGEILIPAGALGFVAGAYDEKYKAVQKAGREFAETGRVSARTMQVISAEIMPAEDYVAMVNKFFEKQRRREDDGP
ncbi:MAG: flavodoxin family protein [Dethiobacteria bacterium]